MYNVSAYAGREVQLFNACCAEHTPPIKGSPCQMVLDRLYGLDRVLSGKS